MRTIVESNPTFKMSTVSFSNFSGVILLRIPRIWKDIGFSKCIKCIRRPGRDEGKNLHSYFFKGITAKFSNASKEHKNG